MQDAAIEVHVWEEIIGQCQAAAALSNRNAVVYLIWGDTLLAWARLSSGEEQAERLAEACRKYDVATTLNPERADAYNNWGATLLTWARVSSGEEQAERFAEACRKYEKATTLNPEYADAYNNWGNALLTWAQFSSGNEQVSLVDEAEEKVHKTEELRPGSGAYNLACVAALRGQPDTCRYWLATTYQHKDTPTADHLASDPDLAAVCDQQWFKDLVAERRRIEAGESVTPASPPPSNAPDECFSPKPAL
jgi:tetratricopeptide (TPR) repeat protein